MNVNARNRVHKPFNESKLKKAVCGLLGPLSSRVDPETSSYDNRDLIFIFGQRHSNCGAISSKNDILSFGPKDQTRPIFMARVRSKAQRLRFKRKIPQPLVHAWPAS